MLLLPVAAGVVQVLLALMRLPVLVLLEVRESHPRFVMVLHPSTTAAAAQASGLRHRALVAMAVAARDRQREWERQERRIRVAAGVEAVVIRTLVALAAQASSWSAPSSPVQQPV